MWPHILTGSGGLNADTTAGVGPVCLQMHPVASKDSSLPHRPDTQTVAAQSNTEVRTSATSLPKSSTSATGKTRSPVHPGAEFLLWTHEARKHVTCWHTNLVEFSVQKGKKWKEKETTGHKQVHSSDSAGFQGLGVALRAPLLS